MPHIYKSLAESENGCFALATIWRSCIDLSQYTAPIEDTVLYANTEEEPTSDQRMVEVIANDGLVQSNPSFVVVNIVTQNAPSFLGPEWPTSWYRL